MSGSKAVKDGYMDVVVWTESPRRQAWWESVLGLDVGQTASTPIPAALEDGPNLEAA